MPRVCAERYDADSARGCRHDMRVDIVDAMLLRYDGAAVIRYASARIDAARYAMPPRQRCARERALLIARLMRHRLCHY